MLVQDNAMEKYRPEIDAAVRDLAKKEKIPVDNLQYLLVCRDNGFCVISYRGFRKLDRHQKRLLLGSHPRRFIVKKAG